MIHIQTVAIQMNGDEEANLRLLAQRRLAKVEVDQSVLVHIHEDRYRAELQDRQCGGEGGNRRGEDFLARSTSQGAQGDFYGIQSTRDTDGMFDAKHRRKRRLKFPNLLTQDVRPARAYGG